jgi:uncharacterized protein (DUF58 family)
VSLVFKFIYRFYHVSSSLWYWAGRRFTRAGLCVLGALFVGGAAGLDVENTVAYQIFTLALALLVPAFACSCFFRMRFSATRHLPRFGTVGHPLVYPIAIKNLTARAQSGLVLLENPADPRPAFQEWRAAQMAEGRRGRSFRFSQRRRTSPFKVATLKEAEIPPLPSKGETEARVELLPLRRGVLRLAGLTLARPDPLGLFRSFVEVPAPQTVLILPKRYPLPPIALPGAMKYQEGGVALAANVGRSEEFVALRDYRHGDPLRHIHWRSWARAGKPIVKEFEDEFFVRHALVLDTFTSDPHSERLEEAVSVAASFACTVLTQESLLDLLFVGPQSYCFTAGRGLAQADQMLEILAAVRSCSDKPFQSLEHLMLDHVAVVSGCVCVLLAWDEARRRLVEKLQVLGVPVLVLVIAPAGQTELDAGPLRDEPDRFRVLESGRIEQGLAALTG